VPRAALQELLFPEKDERSGAQSLRQLLYKLRHVGAPLEIDASSVGLDTSLVGDDLDGFGLDESTNLTRASAGVLPNYVPTVSDTYARWLDGFRDGAVSRVRVSLLRALERARLAGNAALLESVASCLLQLDPLNEEATLARAEALALSGQKSQALQLLQTYLSEVGATRAPLRVPADILRHRISEHFNDDRGGRRPLIGREQEFLWLQNQFDRARRGVFTVTFLWGEAGVGKTRLIQEFLASLRLKATATDVLQCQPGDEVRPLGLVRDLTHHLLGLRGALGISPESLALLRQFVGVQPVPKQAEVSDLDFGLGRVSEALGELIAVVGAETATVLIVEDVHWADEDSIKFLHFAAAHFEAPVQFIITARPRSRALEHLSVTQNLFVRELEPLGSPASMVLFDTLTGSDPGIEESTRTQCLSLAAGNPLFLGTIAEHLHVRGEAPDARSSLSELLRQRVRVLSPVALLLLRCAAVLGKHATNTRLRAASGAQRHEYLLAIQDLVRRGLIAGEGDAVRVAHDLISAAVLEDCADPIRSAIGEGVAAVLEEEGMRHRREDLLWAAAEAWQFAANLDRATQTFERYADLVEEIGQPRLAYAALERAQMTSRTCSRELIERTIRLAQVATDPQGVLRNVARLREMLRRDGLAIPKRHPAHLAEMAAVRMTEAESRHLRPTLREWVLDASQPAHLRIDALRGYLVIAATYLASDDAIDFMRTATAALGNAATGSQWLYIQMLYHVTFGNVDHARIYAEELLQSVDKMDVHTISYVHRNAALAYLESGAATQAVELLHEGLRVNERLASPLGRVENYCGLVDTHLSIGELSKARDAHDSVERMIRTGEAPCIGFVLLNGVFLSLCERNASSARRYLDQLRVHSHLPQATRSILALDVLVGALENTLRPELVDLDALEQMHVTGVGSYGHDILVAGLVQAYWICDMRDRAIVTLREYLNASRRTRYPIWPSLNGYIADHECVSTLQRAIDGPVVDRQRPMSADLVLPPQTAFERGPPACRYPYIR